MNKLLSLSLISLFVLTLLFPYSATANTQRIIPKKPYVSEGMKPVILKYKKGDYTGSMQDVVRVLSENKNDVLAEYYLALCFTKLGLKEEAKNMYKKVVEANNNLVLSHYSKQALSCLDNPNGTLCKPQREEAFEENSEPLTDMDRFIQSGKTFHPAAMDRITRERMERRIQEEEYIKSQKEQNKNSITYNMQPTNEEIASALNTLSKIGINPYNQFNPLAQAQQFNQFGMYGNNQSNMYSAFLNNNTNPEIARMFMHNQMNQQKNNMINYGI